MRLGAFLQPTGHHIAGWCLPDAFADMGGNFSRYAELAQAAEKALFDIVFVGDTSAVWTTDAETLSRMPRSHLFEPFTLMAALSAVTRHIGFIATASTSYNEPLHLARKLASVDHISGGRIGWNVVTTVNQLEALNFGRDAHLGRSERYERAEEFVDVVRGLLDSWADDAVVLDKADGRFFDPARLHVLDHHGKHFKVRGPLNIARSPQGHPVFVQAGSSEVGKTLASRVAEIVFTAQNDFAQAKDFYDDIKARAAAHGRDPDKVLVMPGVMPVVADSEAAAWAKVEQLQALVHPLAALQVLKDATGGVDLSGYPLDEPFPQIDDENYKSRLQVVTDIARRENLTLRQLALKVSISRGHRLIVGTPEQVADALEDWFQRGAVDGYNIMPASMPSGLEDFTRLVVPELQRRGLFKTAYTAGTLRDKLGLARPANRYFPTAHGVTA